ncbi:MAG: sulfatase-like hydrolase/transferase [Sulfitobacter sp.]
MSDIEYALWLLAILAVVIALTRVPRFVDGRARRRYLLKLLVLVPPIALIFPLTVVVLIFGKTDLAAFVFHLVFAMDGTPLGHVVPYILTALIYWGVILVTLYRLHYLLARIPFWWVAIAVFILAVNPLIHDVAYNRLYAEYGNVPSLMKHFAEPQVIDAQQGPKPDLIVVYLEGLEQTYGQDSFGAILDPLKELMPNAVVLDNVGQAFGTGWSLGGTVSSLCGVVLLPQGARPQSQMSDVQYIVPEVRCLPDILSERGYDMTYMSTVKITGEKMGYYGFDNFFGTHQLTHIIDRDNADTPRARAGRKQALDGWGLRDQDLFEIGLDTVKERIKADRPYALFLATMDTHGPYAFMSPSCVEAGQPATSGDLADAVQCSSRLVRDFVEDVRTLTKGRPTRIVLTSDHLAHHNNLADRLEQYDRRNLVMLIGGDDAPRVISKPAMMADLYPTLLEWLDLSATQPTRAGIGMSLLGDEPTLTETLTPKGLDRRLKVDVPLARHIWRQQ